MPGCIDFDKICSKEIYHQPEMKDSFDELPESLQEKMSNEEYESYMVDVDVEKQFEKEVEYEKGEHLAICEDVDCKRIKDHWSKDERLQKLVQVKENN